MDKVVQYSISLVAEIRSLRNEEELADFIEKALMGVLGPHFRVDVESIQHNRNTITVSFFESARSAQEAKAQAKDKIEIVESMVETLSDPQATDENTLNSSTDVHLHIIKAATIKVFVTKVAGESLVVSIPWDSSSNSL